MSEATERLKRDLIVFDLDGTLIDSSGDIVWSANMTFKELSLPERDPLEIKEAIGWGVRMLFEQLLKGSPDELIDMARETFMGYYRSHLVVDTVLYEGVLEALELFFARRKRMAIVSNKPISLTEEVLEELSISRFFDPVYGGDSFVQKKPHPEPLLRAMDAVGRAPEETVFVGDSRVDIETGKAAGVKTVGASFGFRGRAELEGAGADAIIDSFSELMSMIE